MVVRKARHLCLSLLVPELDTNLKPETDSRNLGPDVLWPLLPYLLHEITNQLTALYAWRLAETLTELLLGNPILKTSSLVRLCYLCPIISSRDKS
jgi:hypothetical protein